MPPPTHPPPLFAQQVFAGVLSPAMNPETGSDASLSQSGETSASATTVDDAPVGGDAVNDDSAAAADKPHIALRNAVDTLGVVLSGYAVSVLEGGRERCSCRVVFIGGVFVSHRYILLEASSCYTYFSFFYYFAM